MCLLSFPAGRRFMNNVHGYTGCTQMEMTGIRPDTAHFLRFVSLFYYRTLLCTPALPRIQNNEKYMLLQCCQTGKNATAEGFSIFKLRRKKPLHASIHF